MPGEVTKERCRDEGDGGNDVNNEWMNMWPQCNQTKRAWMRSESLALTAENWLSLDYGSQELEYGSGTLEAFSFAWIWKIYRTQLCLQFFNILWNVPERNGFLLLSLCQFQFVYCNYCIPGWVKNDVYAIDLSCLIWVLGRTRFNSCMQRQLNLVICSFVQC